MKKLSNFHRRVLNIVVTLMAAIALMLGNVTSVAAYTADTPLTGYPLIVENMEYADGTGFYHPVLGDDNIYYFTMPEGYKKDYLSFIRFGSTSSNFIYPYSDLYDYYLIGTYAFEYRNVNNYTFSPTRIQMNAYNYNGQEIFYELTDVNFYDYSNFTYMGNSFSAKLPSGVSTIGYFNFLGNGSVCGDIVFSASIVPVAKSGSEADTLNSILQTLTQINQNIITGNTLQQQTIDAVNANTTNTTNWFNTLITTLQGWFNTRTEDLRTWFYMIEERMSAGFTALYHQMTKEQDEKLNGYEDTTQSDAADNFNTESDKLTELEDQLNNQSHDFVSDYTTTGFNTGVLTTLSSSLIFVTTWFANFWNMGGIFTAGLNLCFSLSIVFFILRLRR